MTVPLLTTKIVVPRTRQTFVTRPHLLARLDVGLRRRLTLVSAPAGFGKTTLIAAWAKQTDYPVAWLSLDERDNDRARFFAYLTAALARLDIGLGPAALSAPELSQTFHAEPAMTALINQINTLTHDLVLVLDDYHLVTASDIHDLVTFLLEHQPSHLHLIFATRADPPLPLARFRGRGQLQEIRAADLRFSPEEAAIFLDEVMGVQLAPADVARLTRRTEGWVVGLQMAALSMQGRDDLPAFITAFAGNHRYVMDYLLEEVLDLQPEPVHRFLLQTSVLDQMSAPLCDAVRQAGDSHALLASLEQDNLFIVALDDRRAWFRYHRLFADLLRQRLERQHPNLVPELHRRAGRWYEAQAMMPQAIDHALMAKDAAWAAALIDAAAEATLLRSESATFLRWVEALPDAEVCQRPALCIFRAWALLLSGRPLDEVEFWLNRLEELPEHQIGQAMALQALLALYRGDMPEMADLAQSALQTLAPHDLLFRGIVTSLSALRFMSDGNLATGGDALLALARDHAASGNVMAALMAFSTLGELRVRQCRLHEATEVYQRALAVSCDDRGERLPAAGPALIGLGTVALMQHKIEEAIAYLEEGIALARQVGDIIALDGFIALARAHQASGNGDAALGVLDEALQIARNFDITDIDDFAIALERTRLWLSQGRLVEVRAWLEARGLVGPLDSLVNVEGLHPIAQRFRKYELMMIAKYYLVKGRYDEALAALDWAGAQIEARGRISALVEVLTTKAMVYDKLGRRKQAQAALDRALVLSAPGGYLQAFVEAGAALTPLLRAAQQVEPAFVARVVAVIEDAYASVERMQPAGLLDPLTEREMEVLAFLPSHLSSTEIADRLYVSPSTTRTHIKNIYSKLNVHSRDDAVQRARELGIL